MSRIACLLILLMVGYLWPGRAHAQLLSYPDPSLDSIYPAGAQAGQTVQVELRGLNGLQNASEIIVDGAAGISVADVKSIDAGHATATFTIAADAVPGRRRVRVKGGANGLTNYRSFFVGRLPEVIETEDPNHLAATYDVPVPVVINARIDPTLDMDAFRFVGRKGQHIVAAVLAHRMDSLSRQAKSAGFLDTSLELLSDDGTILATAEDSLGLDPLIACSLPADGHYVVRVKSLSFYGFPQAVYRLTLGEVPYPTSVFPPGGRRGETLAVEFSGPNVPAGSRQMVTIDANEIMPLQDIAWEGCLTPDPIGTLMRGTLEEMVESPANDGFDQATAVPLSICINGRFESLHDEDWYRLTLKQQQSICVETLAQRHLFSPVDTVLEIYDPQGKLLVQNDDGRPFANECIHDFAAHDSYVTWTAPEDGEYRVRVRDQAQGFGSRAVYRLEIKPHEPDFDIYLWPDAVPLWGPGSTAAFVVQVLPRGNLAADIELTVVDLPVGWTGSICRVPASSFGNYNDTEYGIKALLTITAPAEAMVGSIAAFRVLGRAVQHEHTIEHIAQPLSLLGNSHNDRMLLRHSPDARAVIAPPMDVTLITPVTELTVPFAGQVEVPVIVQRHAGAGDLISVSIDGQTVAANCAWRSPLAVAGGQEQLVIPLQLNNERTPGIYSIVVSRSWASDLRLGRPGPCTPLIQLHVLPAEAPSP